MTSVLGRVAAAIAADPDAVKALQAGPDAAKALFDVVDRHSRAVVDDLGIAVTIYEQPGSTAVAWAGRPSDIPGERTRGVHAWFVTPAPLGLRLVHVLPIGTGDHPLGVVAVEYPLSPSPAGASIARAEYLFDTRVGPAPLRMRYEGAGDQSRPDTIVLRAPGGEPLVEASLAEAQIAHARSAWRRSVGSVVLVVVAITLLLLIGPSLDTRAGARDARTYLTANLLAILLLLSAAGVIYLAMRLAQLDRSGTHGALLLFGATAAALVALLASPTARLRIGWRGRRRVPLDRPLRFALEQLLAGLDRRGLDPALRPRPSRGSGRRVGGPAALFPAPMERREAHAARRHSGVPPGGIVGGNARVRDRSRTLAIETGVACRAGDRASLLGRASAGHRCRRCFTGVADPRLGRDRFHRCLCRVRSPRLPRRRVVPTCHRRRADPGTVHRVSTSVAALVPIREFLHGTKRPQRHRDALQRRGTDPLPDAAGAPGGGTCGDR